MSTLRVNNLTNQANDGGIEFAVQPVIDGLCKAWVNFNGTGTVAIRASYNVSSITDNDTGDYRVNFATSMPDTNYIIVGSTGTNSNGKPPATFNINRIRSSGNHVDSTTSAVRVSVDPVGDGDSKYVNVAIFR